MHVRDERGDESASHVAATEGRSGVGHRPEQDLVEAEETVPARRQALFQRGQYLPPLCLARQFA